MAKIILENGTVVEGTPEEIAAVFAEMEKQQAKVEPEAEALKVGDYVKVINADYRSMRGFKNGDIAEILFNPHGKNDEDYRLNKVNSGNLGYVPKVGGYVVRATEEEVAATRTEVKWAKIDRKVDEYKKGDIVRVLEDNANGSEHKGGDIGEIVTDGNECVDKAFRVKTPRIDFVNWVRPRDIELITPVEARFDR